MKIWFTAAILFFIFIILYLFRRWSSAKRPYTTPSKMIKPKEWKEDEVTVGWIGHSTVLINIYGYKIITDPVLGQKVGVALGNRFQIGMRRHRAPAISLEDLEEVDLILLSHAHFDHFDLPSLRRLASPRTKVITAKGTSHLLKRISFQKVYEIGDQEQLELPQGLKITAVPVKHWGNRFHWNIRYGYTGYLIEKDKIKIFYPGDTAYIPDLSWLKEEGEIDLAFMPIGAYKPDILQRHHCTPEQAWDMFVDTGARWLAPIHWNTFVLSMEPIMEPLERLQRAAGKEKDRIVFADQGEIFSLQKERVEI